LKPPPEKLRKATETARNKSARHNASRRGVRPQGAYVARTTPAGEMGAQIETRGNEMT